MLFFHSCNSTPCVIPYTQVFIFQLTIKTEMFKLPLVASVEVVVNILFALLNCFLQSTADKYCFHKITGIILLKLST